jgi:auxin-responsive protein IAA
MELDADNLSATELRLGLPGTSSSSSDDWQKKPSTSVGAKRALDDGTKSEASGTSPAAGDLDFDHDHDHDTAAPPK